METDRDLDSIMDAHLRGVGGSWRDANPLPVQRSSIANIVMPVTVDRKSDRHGHPNRRFWMVGVAAVLIGIVSLAVTATIALGPEAPQQSANSAGSLPAPSSISDVTWRLELVTSDGERVAKPARAVRSTNLQVVNGILTAGDGCNTITGPVKIEDQTIMIGDVRTTLVDCLGIDDFSRAIAVILSGAINWTINDGRLTLSRTGYGELVYVAA